MRTVLVKRVGRLEEKLHLSELDRTEMEKQAKENEELMELLRQEEAYQNWLKSASIEELENTFRRLMRNIRRT